MIRKLDQILSLFTHDRPELTGPEIAQLVGRPKSTVYRLLGNFTTAGYLDQDKDTARYRLGIRLASLGEIARHSTALQRVALPSLRQLAEDTGELATLMVLSGAEGVTIDVVESYHPLMLPGLLGGHLPLHATAGGKALLAWRSEAEWRRILRPPLKRYTTSTLTDLADLMADFVQARKSGYTEVHGEWVEDVVGVAAPVWNHRRDVVAAVTCGGPRTRTTRDRLGLLAQAALRAAAEVSRNLGYSWPRGNGAPEEAAVAVAPRQRGAPKEKRAVPSRASSRRRRGS